MVPSREASQPATSTLWEPRKGGHHLPSCHQRGSVVRPSSHGLRILWMMR
ncbi:hypothetical protein E2C01_059569 [Portunus trituberculatus]|uniref:Uncharacterized protein n=1 Tax=Portunus trituberculatus TaxID=210409 RepID=A0A5B7H722_PORTR|nr:hypothetical protein [Portunus trituberculatus]